MEIIAWGIAGNSHLSPAMIQSNQFVIILHAEEKRNTRSQARISFRTPKELGDVRLDLGIDSVLKRSRLIELCIRKRLTMPHHRHVFS